MNRMLRSMTGADLIEWQAYEALEPFGEERADLRMAIVGAFLGNVLYQMHTGKEDAPFTPEDLMPKFAAAQDETPTMSEEEAARAIEAMFMSLGALNLP